MIPVLIRESELSKWRESPSKRIVRLSGEDASRLMADKGYTHAVISNAATDAEWQKFINQFAGDQ